jgi:MFS family permease
MKGRTISKPFRVFQGSNNNREAIYGFPYAGNGTETSPFLVDFIPNDPENAVKLSKWRKWMITIFQGIATLAVTFASSAYTGGLKEIIHTFDVSQEVATLGVSLFVLGFALGPLIWAPLSEVYGRRTVFIFTYIIASGFCAGAAFSKNIQTLLVLRFFAGAFGASTLANGGGVIADMFERSERGLATSIFAMAPFLGPAIGENFF